MDYLIAGLFAFVAELFGEKIGLFFMFGNSKKLSERSRKIIKTVSGILAFIMFVLFAIGLMMLVSEDVSDSLTHKLGLIFVIVSGSYIALVVILMMIFHFVTRKKTKKKRR